VPGGWSIDDEMTFYLLLPMLVATLRSWATKFMACVAAYGLSMLGPRWLSYGWLFRGLYAARSNNRLRLVSQSIPASWRNNVLFAGRGSRGPPLGAAQRTARRACGICAVGNHRIPFAAMALRGDLVHTTYVMTHSYTCSSPLGT